MACSLLPLGMQTIPGPGGDDRETASILPDPHPRGGGAPESGPRRGDRPGVLSGLRAHGRDGALRRRPAGVGFCQRTGVRPRRRRHRLLGPGSRLRLPGRVSRVEGHPLHLHRLLPPLRPRSRGLRGSPPALCGLPRPVGVGRLGVRERVALGLVLRLHHRRADLRPPRRAHGPLLRPLVCLPPLARARLAEPGTGGVGRDVRPPPRSLLADLGSVLGA